MPLEPEDEKHRIAAHGYMNLGMFDQAEAELEQIAPDTQHVPEVLLLRRALFSEMKRWDAMAVAAGKLVECEPSEPNHFVQFAHATRQAESLKAARDILWRAEARHPNDGRIQYDLTRYEAQLGNIETAREHLKRALAAGDNRLKWFALTEPDLQPLWPPPGNLTARFQDLGLFD